MSINQKILLKVAYDGTHFAGWQVQDNGPSIQRLIEEKLSMILRHHVTIHGSGRTDSGVHALGQTAHFETTKTLDYEELVYRLNCVLPLSIRILEAKQVDKDFHARFSVVKKTYLYKIHHDVIADPFNRLSHWHISYPLDYDLIQTACDKLKGLHDFKAFAAKNTQGPASVDSIRRLEDFKMIPSDHKLYFELTAKGFLYKMVRNLVGCVIDIGSKKLDLECIDEAFKTGNRTLVGATAPACGLYLKEVFYT